MLKGPALAKRYSFLRRLTDASASAVWLAEDEQTGFFVIASVLPQSRVRLVREAVGLQHPHLATLLALVDDAPASDLPNGVRLERGAAVAVAEWISGATLYDALLDSRMSVVGAVRTVASIASAVSAMHARGAVHGAISPRAVVLDRMDGGTVPVITQASVPADGSFCSLERIEGRGPSEADDAWALHVMLYNALTGRRPYRAKSHDALVRALRSARPISLAALDVDDPLLHELLDDGLQTLRSQPLRRVSEFESELYRWLNERGQPPSQRSSPLAEELSSPQIEIGTFVDSSMPGLRAGMPTMMPPAPVSDREELALEAPPLPRPSEESRAGGQGDGPDGRTTPTEPFEEAAEPVGTHRTNDEGSTAGTPAAEEAAPIEPGVFEAPDEPPVAAVAAPSDSAMVRHERDAAQEIGLRESGREVVQVPETSALAADNARGSWLLWVVAGAGVLLIVGSVAVFSAFRRQSSRGGDQASISGSASASSSAHPSAPSSTSAASNPAALRPVDSAAVPGQPPSPAELAACTARHFPPQTFQVGQDLSFVCSLRDPRDITKRMLQRIVVGSRGALTPAMNEWSRLGWYQLAAVAIVRGECCPNPPAFALPALSMCKPLDAALNRIAADTASGQSLAPSRAEFEDAAGCAYRSQPRDYPYRLMPQSGGQFVFDEFLRRNAK